MCGICGIYFYNSSDIVQTEILNRMNNTIIHRGPDDFGSYVNGKIGLAMRRLSIIDPIGGHQPIHNENKTVWIVCNGEIYNFLQLKKELQAKGHIFYTRSDTEIIVHLYEEYGENFLNLLSGMFGLALWDSANNKLIIACDHTAIKPLYYYVDKDKILFGSELKTLLEFLPKPELNIEALVSYLSFLYINTPLSIYKNIYKLSPGQYMVITPQKYEIKKFWEIKYAINEKITEKEALHQLENIIEKTVESHLISDMPLGAFLSGGLDSSIIVYYMSKLMKEPVKTFSVGFKEKAFDETPEATLIANYLKTDHTNLLIEPNIENTINDLLYYFDEPFADYCFIPLFYVSKLAREKVKVVLTGDGGDELFGGYQTYYAQDVVNYYKMIPKCIRIKLIKPIINNLPASFDRITIDYMAKRFVNGAELPVEEAHYAWKAVFNLEEKQKLFNAEYRGKIIECESVNFFKNIYKSLPANLDIKNKLMHIDFSSFLPDNLLTKSDRMSMANGLEARVPFCDKQMIEFAATLKGDLKVKGFSTKYLFRKIAAKYLPPKISKLRKKGFSPPVAYWLFNELRNYTDEILSEQNIKTINIFDYKYIAQLKKEHFNKQKDHNRKLWALIMFVNWWFHFYKK